MFEDQHQGGWGGGFTTAMNATFDLNHDLATYDTLEMFHEHACSERRDRYQTSSGGYAGCHEWDYEANLRICDRDNASKCGTEFARWITTYGREGRWLTDLSPTCSCSMTAKTVGSPTEAQTEELDHHLALFEVGREHRRPSPLFSDLRLHWRPVQRELQRPSPLRKGTNPHRSSGRLAGPYRCHHHRSRLPEGRCQLCRVLRP